MQRRRFLHALGVLGSAGALGETGSRALAAGPDESMKGAMKGAMKGSTEVDDSALAGTSGGTLSAWRGATPAFSLPSLDGTPHALSDYRGRVVILNFWATWCGPCRDEIPAMGAVVRQYRQRGLALLAVNYKELLTTVKPFLDKLPIDGTVLLDADGALYKRFGSLGLPATYLVDRAGNVRYWRMGELDWRDVGLHGHIEALIAQKGGATA